MDLFADQLIHRQPGPGDGLDLLGRQFGQYIVVSDVDAELISTTPTAGVAAEPTGEPCALRVTPGYTHIDEVAVLVPTE